MCQHVTKTNWGEVRRGIFTYNPLLAEALDEVVCGNAGVQLYRASYKYANLIVDRGIFCSPCDPGACPDCRELIENTRYSVIPLAIVERQSAEVFLECQRFCTTEDSKWDCEDTRLVPLRLIGPGELFGTFEVLDTLLGTPDVRPNWSVSAGARSVWIIAPLKDVRVSKWVYNIRKGTRWSEEKAPHWRLIQVLEGGNWAADILIFPESVVRAAEKAPRFYRTLLESGWRQSANLRHASIAEFSLWENFNKSATKTPLGELYHYATVRHLLAIANGNTPGFQPSHRAPINAGPFDKVENALASFLPTLNKEFGKYAPVILQPAHLGLDGDIAYYSFRCPSLPGPRLEKSLNWSAVPAATCEALKAFRKDRNVMLDFKETTFFARSGEYSVELNSRLLPSEELLIRSDGGELPKEIFFNSTFFVAGCRIVRNAASQNLSSEHHKTAFSS